MEQQFATTLWTRVEQAAAGSGDALEWLIHAYYSPVYAVVDRLLRGQRLPDADCLVDDVVQAAFLHLFKNPDLIGKASRHHGGKFRAFMIGVVKHLVKNELKKHRLRANGVTDPANLEGLGASDAELDRAWVAGVVNEAVDRLRQELRQSGQDDMSSLVAMALLENQKPAEIAKVLKWKPAEVSRALYRARLRLRILIRAVVRDQRRAWDKDASNVPDWITDAPGAEVDGLPA